MFVSSPSRRMASRLGIHLTSVASSSVDWFRNDLPAGLVARILTQAGGWQRCTRVCLALLFVAYVCVLGAVSCLASAQQHQASGVATELTTFDEPKPIAPIPVTRILLYSSGLAQVLHEGEVEDNVLMELPFSSHDVDDVLKSLILDDEKGTKQTIVYTPTPDREAIAAKEHEDPLSFAQLLQKYRGERIKLKSSDQVYTGHILGVENRIQKQEVIETLLLMTDKGIQAVSINGLSELNFESQVLKQELEAAFAGLVKGRDATRRRVGLRFEGQGKRRVRFSYVVDAPIWRITYRLALEDQTSQLQSWVHLDNVFGYDWNEIEIVLRSGRPAAFHADLFAPILAERKSVGTSVFDMPNDVTLVMQWFGFDPPVRFGLKAQAPANLSMIAPRNEPFEYEGGMGGGMGGMGGGGMGGDGMGGGFAGAAGNTNDDQINLNRVIKQASNFDSKLGLLEFKLKQRVSLSAGKSAAIPLWEEKFPSLQQGELDGGSLLFNQEFESVQSMIELENNRELPLLMAPVAIFEAGSFVGDSKLEATAPQDTVRILHGIDGGVQIKTRVRTESKQLESFQHLGLESWLARRKRIAKVTLSIKNQHQKDKRIQLNFSVPFQARIKPEMEMIRQTSARLIQTVGANSKKNLEFEVSYLDEERLDTDSLLSNKKLLEEGARLLNETHLKRLNQLIELRLTRDTLTKNQQQLNTRRMAILADQSRWSDLVKKLELSIEARNKYVALITDAEDKIAAIGLELTKTQQELEVVQRRWDEILDIRPLEE